MMKSFTFCILYIWRHVQYYTIRTVAIVAQSPYIVIFYEKLVKFFIGTKVLVIGPFLFLRPNVYFVFFKPWYVPLLLFGLKLVVKNESVIFLSQNVKYEIL